jgi:plastocyanin
MSLRLPIVVLAAAGAFVLAACGGDDVTTPASPATGGAPAATPTAAAETPTPAPETPTPAAGGGAANEVSTAIGGFALPSQTISVGTTLVWTNQDDFPHTATANDRSFDSGTLSTGESFRHTFTEAGSYDYFCEIHPTMTATITVE